VIGWRIERRYEVSRALLSSTPVLAVALTLAAGMALFCGLGIDAGAALYHCFRTVRDLEQQRRNPDQGGTTHHDRRWLRPRLSR
jgi:hypothetical protein